ncbi:MAG: Gfo/Idh/MocA family oxidoreductase [Firmicutes bacterium]|nr:Gfo/Idh/MocA family oxidoreductase [Bacillota bacterium]
MASKTRCGLVGCGVIGPKHARILKSLPSAELIAVCDIVPERAQKLGEELSVEWLTSLDELIARDDIECINICTPSGMHGDMAIAAMRAGKHVIVEKPMDITLDKIDAMIKTAEETGRILAGIFNYRFNSASIKIKQAVEEGRLGKLVLGDAYVKWYRSQAYYDSGDWRGTWALDGGGSLMNQSVHFIDLLQWIMGPVESLSANVATLAHKDIEVEDVATATLKFKNGALGVIEGTTSVTPANPGRLEIHGTKGTIILEEDKITRWSIEGEEELLDTQDATLATSDPGALALEGHAAEIAHVLDVIQNGGKPAVDGVQARRAVEIILAIYESARTGKKVVLG